MKLILICLVSLVGSVSLAGVDYQCSSDCMSKGYMMNYCNQKCSYEDNPYSSSNSGSSFSTTKQIDYQCSSDCMKQGYMLNYCNQKCSY